MKVEILTGRQILDLSELSKSLGNIPLVPGQSLASVMYDNQKIVGFAAVQGACHAAGSWVHPDYRGQKLTYSLRSPLEAALKANGILIYFAFPGNDFEKQLFAKYGPTTEKLAQIRTL